MSVLGIVTSRECRSRDGRSRDGRSRNGRSRNCRCIEDGVSTTNLMIEGIPAFIENREKNISERSILLYTV
jgi:hypothetical protein